MTGEERRNPHLKVAIMLWNPIPHFAGWFKHISDTGPLVVRVFYGSDGTEQAVHDPAWGRSVAWGLPLLEGYDYRVSASFGVPFTTALGTGFKELGAALSLFGPDVILVFGYAKLLCWQSVLWARRSGIPVMVLSDSHIAANDVPTLRRWVRSVIRAIFYSCIDGAFAVGDKNRLFHELGGLPRSRVFDGVLPVETDRLRLEQSSWLTSREKVRRHHSIPAEGFVALFCGKLSERKRPILFAESIMRARESLQSVDLYGVLVGDGPLREQLQALAVQSSGCVVPVGFIDQVQMPEYFAAADVLVVTSSWDPHPVVVSEACALGLPIIVSDSVGCVGAGDTARPGVNALVVPSRSETGFAEALVQVATDEMLRTAFRLGSRSIGAGLDIGNAAELLVTAVGDLVRDGPLGRRLVRLAGGLRSGL